MPVSEQGPAQRGCREEQLASPAQAGTGAGTGTGACRQWTVGSELQRAGRRKPCFDPAAAVRGSQLGGVLSVLPLDQDSRIRGRARADCREDRSQEQKQRSWAAVVGSG